MKTAVLLVALLIQIDLAVSFAQPTEISITLKPGYNLVANPLTASDNSIGNLFKNMQGGVPPGTKVFKFVNGTFITITWDDLDNQFIPPSAAGETTLPGDGVFVFIPGSENKTLTFTGEIQQTDPCALVPKGFSIKSHPYPYPASGNKISLRPPIIWDPLDPPGTVKIFRFNTTTRAYDMYTLDELDNKWIPDPGPVFQIGEAFFIYRAGGAIYWCWTA